MAIWLEVTSLDDRGEPFRRLIALDLPTMREITEDSDGKAALWESVAGDSARAEAEESYEAVKSALADSGETVINVVADAAAKEGAG